MGTVTLGFAASAGGFVGPSMRRTGFTASTWWYPLVVLAGMWVFMTGYMKLLTLLGVESLAYLDSYHEAKWPLWSAFVLVSVCPAFFEEIAFRGVIQSRLQTVMNARDAIIVQAAMFSVLHMAPLIFVSHFIMGLGFGILRHKTGSLWPAILAHMVWNAGVLMEELVL